MLSEQVLEGIVKAVGNSLKELSLSFFVRLDNGDSVQDTQDTRTQNRIGKLFSFLYSRRYGSTQTFLSALTKFKAGERTIPVATDVASRDLDNHGVGIVINHDIPNNGQDYVHRVVSTPCVGRAGRALNLVSQYDLHKYRDVEELIWKKLDVFQTEEATVLLMLERVGEAQRIAFAELKTLSEKRKFRGGGKRRGPPRHEDTSRLTKTTDFGASALSGRKNEGAAQVRNAGERCKVKGAPAFCCSSDLMSTFRWKNFGDGDVTVGSLSYSVYKH